MKKTNANDFYWTGDAYRNIIAEHFRNKEFDELIEGKSNNNEYELKITTKALLDETVADVEFKTPAYLFTFYYTRDINLPYDDNFLEHIGSYENE
ncbi:MAG: hypothetical protein RR626_06355 [Anaerovoracaceae bacterium]